MSCSLKTIVRSKTFVVFATVLLTLFAEYWYFAQTIDFLGFWFFNATYSAGDALVTTALLLAVLPRRLRIAAVFVPSLVALYLFASGLYFRYSGDVISFRNIFSASSYNVFVFSSGLALLRPADLIWILFAALPPVTAFTYRRKEKFERISPWVKVIFLVIALGLFVAGYRTVSAYRTGWVVVSGVRDYKVSDTIRRNLTDRSNTISELKVNGYVISFIFQLHSLFSNGSVSLSDDERDAIGRFIAGHTDRPVAAADSVAKPNLIFIVVESLNADVIGRVIGGRRLTPVIDSLIEAEGTVSCLAIRSCISIGSSADGQLLYNTGLYPLHDRVVAKDFADNTYYSLAALPCWRSTAEIIGEEAFVWNHTATNAAYGYDRLWDMADIRPGQDYCTDADILQFAAERIPELEQPFFACVTTISSHFPYYGHTEGSAPWITGDDADSNYMRKINDFDRELGRFIDCLKAAGLLDNTVLVLASDHHRPDTPADSPIVFIAANCGRTMKVIGPRSQADVFPTVLDIIRSESDWRGLGRSMLCPGQADVADEAEARRISELIIRGNYFGK